ncbi:TPA: hypothetical protein N3I44_005123 [Klebsiella quasipneumoniae]|uniref:hypothetical protein n=1 Tax=Klebsiella quasipneumoniae TaxID=1463165 RepID=UPI001ABD28B6|nr:hypothetical protein [Klebsiella quasipneumoniae]MBO3690608.1 hypothetical protein [Klebsiella quasipneumoniae subsp. similipneumoniae]HBW1631063.1 hypothetical protein [Klebsiella quasipneumoniae subsp. similipneumoniae]HBW1662277.1 hypothetical protein [Klebsiella quasipneumoniae subsp. similipneumoniae]HBW1678445.1 hypothetical protein [Klebsiella quasipneumoniae subsp. similipneumoniae]HCM3836146.1 hypothetical protein [Klebsiella quasipneumoniae]
MTDITELALIAKIKKQTENFDTVVLKEWEALALVEALEKAQQTEKTLESRNRRLDGIITAAEKRIAELESRTVKLPKCHSMLLREDFNEDYHTEMAYKADEVHASLAAAGIKVEAE